ncbi:MAG TPA: GAF domain-containing protein, partial [Thermoanaerobaculia bacterium]|nr:GAF domain-containing protein [Thermoanaerobaculia bacterium]
MKLSSISRCFQGVVPSLVASSDAHGMPNIVYVSQVYLVDDEHVALSCQFFNKTRRNLDENPNVTVEVYDPVTFQAYRLRLRFLRSEKSGPLFETMAMRIQAIASHTGMEGVFRLIAADVFKVLRVDKVEGFLTDAGTAEHEEVSVTGLRTELRGLQLVSERINRAEDLETLLAATLDALDVYFGFQHTIVLLNDEASQKLVTIACRGYGGGVGAEVAFGEGLIGTVARERRILRITGLNESLRYGRAVRRAVLSDGGKSRPEIPLPGLPDAQSALVIPLLLEERLVGVLAAESREPMTFGEWDEAYLGIIGNQIALGMDRVMESEDTVPAERPAQIPAAPPMPIAARPRRTLTYYKDDDAVFLDNEYLIRNVPGRILWKLLDEWKRQGRTNFTNRELRLDRSLGLPEIKDNLESRLILLRHRLREKCPEVAINSTGRGRFALEIQADLELVE